MRKFLLIISVFVIVLAGCSEKHEADKPIVQTQNTETKTEITDTAKEDIISEEETEDMKEGYSFGDMEHCNLSELIVAIQHEDLEEVKKLIEEGADVNKKIYCEVEYAGEGGDEYSLTPLQGALRGNKEIIETLLKAGANPNVTDDEGKTLLELTSDNEIIQLLLKYGAKDSPLAAFVRNDTEKLKTLLKTATQEEKNDTLIQAVRGNNVSVVQELIKAGANVNVKINLHPYPDAGCVYGTPLSEALNKGYIKIAAILKENDAKENVCTAIESQDLNRIKQIIQEGADLNEEYDYCWSWDCGRSSALIFATEKGNTKIKELLEAETSKE